LRLRLRLRLRLQFGRCVEVEERLGKLGAG
jgi:hypothetical protein